MQSSQRSTSEATSPSSSFVFTGSAPSLYVCVSSAKKRRTTWLSCSRMRSFMRWRNSVNCCTRSTSLMRAPGVDDGIGGKRGGSGAEQRGEPARPVERDHVVVAADVAAVDEDLGNGAAVVRAHQHLLALSRVDFDADLEVFLPLADQVVLRGDAVGADRGAVDLDVGHGTVRGRNP